jgi:3-oxoacyl-[acyl-carrier protein] reductase
LPATTDFRYEGSFDREGGTRMRLQGKVAAITGGALGIGRATALTFAAEGALVALCDVQAEAAEAVAGEIRGRGAKAFAMGVDVGDAGQVQAFVDRVVAEFGRLDVMFANAGIAHSAPFLDHPEAQWHRVLRVNLTGVFLCCQAAARQMVKQGGGRIIAVASINGFRGVENLVGYNAAKAGVIELTRTMAVELAEHGITANAIAPAQIDTRLTRGLPEDARQRRVERIPMGRFGEPEEVAKAALFLASDDAGYITGHTLAVDGGYLAGGLWSRARRPAPPRA